MTLPVGTRLGSYDIVGTLGAGGMGEVYRARDIKLGREVAVKILPASFAADPDRRTRFDREGRLLAALNHPNIAAIHGVESTPDGTALILELVEGETLADRLARGPLRLAEALRVAEQIADALDAAHEQGIIHRDLKPANIKITPKGVVKVLDFGLGKQGVTGAGAGGAGASSQSPTMPATMAGTVLGTAAYMSPQQARGLTVDKRADIWAFGCVLYEMLTGRPPFAGPTVSDTLARILEREPDWTMLPRDTPAPVQRLLRRSLEKDPARRLRDIGDARADLATGELLDTPPSRRVTAPAIMAAAAVAVAVMALAWWMNARAGHEPSVVAVKRLMPLTSFAGDERDPAFSPDGSQVAFSWNGEGSAAPDIYVMQVGGQTPLRLTRSPLEERNPAWSPDGTQIAFIRETGSGTSELVVVPSLGGPERVLHRSAARADVLLTLAPNRPAWTPDGKFIVFPTIAPGVEGLRLHVLSLESGEVRRLGLATPSPYCDCAPAVSPDGRWLAYSSFRAGPWNGDLVVQELGPGVELRGEPLVVPEAGLAPVPGTWSPDSRSLVWSAAGRILEWQRGSETRSLYVGADVIGSLSVSWQRAGNQALIRIVASSRREDEDLWMAPLDPDTHAPSGPPARLVRSTANDDSPQFSHDGTQLAFSRRRGGTQEVWITDAKGDDARQITHLSAYIAGPPRWSPDDRHVALHARVPDDAFLYIVDVESGVSRKLAAGTVPSWSSDGRYLYARAKTGGIRVRVEDGRAEELFEGFDLMESSDGRHLLYGKLHEPGIFSRALDGDVRTNPEERLVDDYRSFPGGYIPMPAGVFYTGIGADGNPRAFRFYDYARREARDLAPVPPRLEGGLALSPDFSRMVYAADEGDSGEDLFTIDLGSEPAGRF